MHDFFAHQDRARSSTRWLLFYFALASFVLAAMLVAVGVAVYPSLFGLTSQQLFYLPPEQLRRYLSENFDFAVAAQCFLGIVLVFYLLSVIRSWTLSWGGGSRLAESLGGRMILATTDQEDERRLMNIVEEMSIASGVPMPQVYVLENDTTINAFAAGTAPDRAVVAVTRGTLNSLNRDELQGVIAHEFSHILNGDMLLNLRLIGVLFGILCLQEGGRLLLRLLMDDRRSSYSSRSSDDKKGNATAVFVVLGVAMFVLGSIGYFLGSLIKAAICRQREFLADASAVQFTRNPQGIGGALVKIRQAGASIAAPSAASMNHFFLAPGVSQLFSFATHPPLEIRIERILGEQAVKQLEEASARAVTPAASHRPAAETGAAGFAPTFANPVAAMKTERTPTKAASAILPPPPLLAATQEPLSACALAYLCLLGDDIAPTDELWQSIEDTAGPLLTNGAKTLRAQVGAVSPRFRIDLLGRSMASLRQLSPAQGRQFLAGAKVIIEADGRVHLHEFLAWRLLKHALREHMPQTAEEEVSESRRTAAAATLLSAMASQGNDDPTAQAKAFAAGWAQVKSGSAPPMPKWTTTQLGAALARLDKASGDWRKRVLDGCAVTARNDQVLTAEEFDMLRTVALLLGMPIPPLSLAASA